MVDFLHIADPYDFTVPLCEFILNEKGLKNHKFLFITNKFENNNFPKNTVFSLLAPFRKNILPNMRLFYKLCIDSDVIYLHGAQLTFLFNIFPWFTKKLVWVINGAELYSLIENPKSKIFDPNRFTLKRAKKHISHIEGDSKLANSVLGSNASFHYSPMYLSNVVNTADFTPTILNRRVKILVGNSNSKNNDHHHILKYLKMYENDIEYIICPLSYGINLGYKEDVKKLGDILFGKKFIPLEDFMPLKQYTKILANIDIAVFNHWRQEAMGVTLTLLSLGKIIYVNPNTTSFESLTKRGFKIFDNNMLFSEGPTIQRDVSENKDLLEKYYSKKVLIDSLESLKI